MKKISILALKCLTAVTAVGLSIASAGATELKFLTSWDTSFDPRVYVAERYADIVKEKTGGELTFVFRGPETVPPFKQLEPVKAGVFDLLFTHGVYHLGEKGLAVVLDGVSGFDPDRVRSTGIFDAIDKYYQEQSNLKLLAVNSAGVDGYQIILKYPLSDKGDWAGRKIRATKSYQGVIETLGGSAAVLPAGEVYSALEKGVVDGAAWPSTGIANLKWNEGAGYRVRPTFGVGIFPIFMNFAKFNALPPEQQQALVDAGKEIEKESIVKGTEAEQAEYAKLEASGMKVTQLSDEDSAKVQKAWDDSMWALGEECCGPVARELQKIAVDNQMTR